MRILSLITALGLCLPGILPGQEGTPFSPPCALPFTDIAMEHDIDEDCGPEGKTSSTANALQNQAKNNFCAPGDPVWITRQSFVNLQQASDQAGVRGGSPPADRSPLLDLYTTSEGDTIGEGTLVQFVGFILEAHHSNVGNGESVNCKRGGRENNDIHIILDESPSIRDFCHTVTAEISPHFRPEDWDSGVLEEIGRPVRLTGALFFDGSHVPCRRGRRASPPRVSVWEIHPIYAVDVCQNTTIARCRVDDPDIWTPLHEFRTEDEREHEAAEPAEPE